MKIHMLMTLAAVSLPLCAGAQTAGTMGTSGTLTLQDKTFIKKAAISGLAEVHDGTLAETQGGSRVKMIGQRMVADHSKANDQLTSIAQQAGDPPPMTVDAKHAAIGKELTGLSGSAFDNEYLQTELTGHEMTIAAFKMEASNGSDPALKSFASQTLPTLEDHLKMIKSAMK